MRSCHYLTLEEEIPVFNEWDNNAENLLTIQDDQHDQEDKDDEMIQEQPPSLADALEIIGKLHLLASSGQPEFHQPAIDLESKPTDAFMSL
jgi:hypothetical protein